MPRLIQISLPQRDTQGLLEQLEGCRGVIGFSLQRNASLKPQGDVVTVEATNDGAGQLQQLLEDPGKRSGWTIVSSEPRSIQSEPDKEAIERETNEATWPEMAALLRRETNITANYLMAMFFAGMVAALGLLSNTLHIVVGAMVIAPGFEPIMRFVLGLLARDGRISKAATLSTGAGYGMLIVGAVAATWLLNLLSSPASPPEQLPLVQYWSTLSASAVLVSLAASAAGAAVIAAQRSVLTAGVMIALALVPSSATIGLAIATAEAGLIAAALLRWAVDVRCVVVGGGVVLAIKKTILQRSQRRLGAAVAGK
jgi:hypothetical protein